MSKPFFYRKFTAELAPEDVVLDDLVKRQQQKSGSLSVRTLPVPLSGNIARYLIFVSAFLLLFLFATAFKIQVLEHQGYVQLAKDNRQRVYYERSLRGVIYDRNGKALVQNLPATNFLVDRRDLPQEPKVRQKLLAEVALVFQKEPTEFTEQIERNPFPVVTLQENLSLQTLLLLESQIANWPGFFLERNIVRDYTAGKEFSHLLGYMGKINQQEYQQLTDYSYADELGKDGLEKSYEQMLRGRPGKTIVIRDAQGREVSREKATEPENGKNLALWLDADLQKILARSLSESAGKVGARKAAAVALDPRNGGVLALVSLPSFDNNVFTSKKDDQAISKVLNHSDQPLFNRAVSGQYLAGSTIKPLLASAALQENIITPEALIDVNLGYIEIQSPYDPGIIYRYHDWKAHGWVDLRTAIAVSSNVYFYTIGGGYKGQPGLGVERIKKYLEMFGWANKTGIDLPGEQPGFLPSPDWKQAALGEPWFIGNTYHFSIGQGYLKATPLQLASSIAAIANSGKLFKPQVAKALVNNNKEIAQEFEPVLLRQNFIEQEYLKIVREGMRDAVRYGSSVMLNDLPFKVAAKTGTAETSRENYFHHWVTVFAPYENPEIVLTILIEEIAGLQSAALPVAKEVLKWYFNR